MVPERDWRHPLWMVLGDPLGTPYEPFDWQREHIHERWEMSRLIGACGRRAGKTLGMRAEVVRDAVPEGKREKPPLIYVMAPNYELSQKIFEPIWQAFVNADGPLNFLKRDHDKTRRIIDLANGGRIQAKSADDPKTIQGDRVTAAYVDEAQDVIDEAWANLMPGLVDSAGKLRAIGVAKGKGRFRSYYVLGEQQEGRFSSFSVSSYANPRIDPAELDAMREEHTDTEFRQLYLAEWVEADGQVFKKLDDVFVGEWEEAEFDENGRISNGPFLMGLDIGKVEDYTVAYVIRATDMRVVAVDRFNGLDYMALGARIAGLYNEYQCATIHMDTTGVGEAAADILRSQHCSISDFKFTRESKARLIGHLIMAIEQGDLILPRDDSTLRKEMELFEGTITPGQTAPKYEAAPGYHDDCVIALALAVQKARKRRGFRQNPNQRPYVTFTRGGERRWRRRKVAA